MKGGTNGSENDRKWNNQHKNNKAAKMIKITWDRIRKAKK